MIRVRLVSGRHHCFADGTPEADLPDAQALALIAEGRAVRVGPPAPEAAVRFAAPEAAVRPGPAPRGVA